MYYKENIHDFFLQLKEIQQKEWLPLRVHTEENIVFSFDGSLVSDCKFYTEAIS